MKFITVPAGRFAAEEDAAAAKRREIACLLYTSDAADEL